MKKGRYGKQKSSSNKLNRAWQWWQKRARSNTLKKIIFQRGFFCLPTSWLSVTLTFLWKSWWGGGSKLSQPSWNQKVNWLSFIVRLILVMQHRCVSVCHEAQKCSNKQGVEQTNHKYSGSCLGHSTWANAAMVRISMPALLSCSTAAVVHS